MINLVCILSKEFIDQMHNNTACSINNRQINVVCASPEKKKKVIYYRVKNEGEGSMFVLYLLKLSIIYNNEINYILFTVHKRFEYAQIINDHYKIKQ